MSRQFFQDWKIHSKNYYDHTKNCKGCNECEIHGSSYEKSRQCSFCKITMDEWRIVDDGKVQCYFCQHKEKECVYRFCANCGNRRGHGSLPYHCTHYDKNELYTLCTDCSNTVGKVCFGCSQSLGEIDRACMNRSALLTQCRKCKQKSEIHRWCHDRCCEDSSITTYCHHCGTLNLFEVEDED